MITLDHVTIRTADIEGTKDFLVALLDLTEGYRPAFGFDGYWLHVGDAPLARLNPGNGGAVNRRGETIDHVGRSPTTTPRSSGSRRSRYVIPPRCFPNSTNGGCS